MLSWWGKLRSRQLTFDAFLSGTPVMDMNCVSSDFCEGVRGGMLAGISCDGRSVVLRPKEGE